MILYPIPYYSPIIPTLSWGGGGVGVFVVSCISIPSGLTALLRKYSRQGHTLWLPLMERFAEIEHRSDWLQPHPLVERPICPSKQVTKHNIQTLVRTVNHQHSHCVLQVDQRLLSKRSYNHCKTTPLKQETKVQDQRTRVQHPLVQTSSHKFSTKEQSHDRAGPISYDKGLQKSREYLSPQKGQSRVMQTAVRRHQMK